MSTLYGKSCQTQVLVTFVYRVLLLLFPKNPANQNGDAGGEECEKKSVEKFVLGRVGGREYLGEKILEEIVPRESGDEAETRDDKEDEPLHKVGVNPFYFILLHKLLDIRSDKARVEIFFIFFFHNSILSEIPNKKDHRGKRWSSGVS